VLEHRQTEGKRERMEILSPVGWRREYKEQKQENRWVEIKIV